MSFPKISYPGHWVEIDEELYWYCVGVLPPIYGPDGMFAIDEPAWHNRFGEAGYNICKSVEDETFWMTQGTVRDMNSPGFWKEDKPENTWEILGFKSQEECDRRLKEGKEFQGF